MQTLEVIRIEHLIPRYCRMPGRPPKDRAAMARALVAKAVYDLPTTRMLLDRLDTDVVLRRLCGAQHSRRKVATAAIPGPHMMAKNDVGSPRTCNLQNNGHEMAQATI